MNSKKPEKWTHPKERVNAKKVRLPIDPPKKGESIRVYERKRSANMLKRRKEATKTGKTDSAPNPKLVMDLKKSDRLRNRELDRLKSAFKQQKFSLEWITKLRISPMTLNVMSLYKHAHDIVPLRVLKNAPFITPAEAHKVLVELGILSGYRNTDKQTITQAIKSLEREGYLVQVPMIGDRRAKPYRMPTNSSMEKFFD
jgi:uncharacterized protein YcgL (UPF0745 family)